MDSQDIIGWGDVVVRELCRWQRQLQGSVAQVPLAKVGKATDHVDSLELGIFSKA